MWNRTAGLHVGSVGQVSPSSATVPQVIRVCLLLHCFAFVVVVVVLKFAVFCNSVSGGDSGRPGGAEHSLHPCVYRERSVHWWPGSSRKGTSTQRNKHEQMWCGITCNTKLSHLCMLTVSAAEYLHPADSVRPGWGCSGEARCHWERGNCSKRAHTTTCPGCKGIFFCSVCIYKETPSAAELTFTHPPLTL